MSSAVDDNAHRRSLLVAALGFTLLGCRGKPERREVTMLEGWLDNWTGVGHVVVGMHRQGYDVELRQFTKGWRATFYWTGTAHSSRW